MAHWFGTLTPQRGDQLAESPGPGPENGATQVCSDAVNTSRARIMSLVSSCSASEIAQRHS